MAVCLAGMACGPPGEPTTLAERCGQEGPIQLLPLALDERIAGLLSSQPGPTAFPVVAPHGDRWLINVHRYDRPVPAGAPLSADDPPIIESSRLVSVGACGGDVRVIAESSRRLRPPLGSEPWVGCDADGMVVFDPSVELSGFRNPDLGCRSPLSTLLSAPDADDEKAPDSLIVTISEPEGGPRALVRARLHPDAPADVETLVRTEHAPHVLSNAQGHVLAITTDAELVDVDARTGTIEVIVEGVAHFDASEDGRFVAWSAGGETETAPTHWFILDRETGVEERFWLGEAAVGETVEISYDGVVSAEPRFGDAIDPPINIRAVVAVLPSLEKHAFPHQLTVEGRIGDSVVVTNESYGETGVIRPGVSALSYPRIEPLMDGSPYGFWADGTRGWALYPEADSEPSTYSIVEFSASTLSPQTVLTGTARPIRTTQGAVLGVANPQFLNDRHGTLMWVGADGSPVAIDHDVHRDLEALNGGARADGTPSIVDDLVVYAVGDLSHERAGLWVAEVPQHLQ